MSKKRIHWLHFDVELATAGGFLGKLTKGLLLFVGKGLLVLLLTLFGRIDANLAEYEIGGDGIGFIICGVFMVDFICVDSVFVGKDLIRFELV